MIYLAKRNCRKLSEVFQFCMTDAVKNVCDWVTTTFELNLTGNYFYLNFLTSFFLNLSYSFGLTHYCPVFPIYTLVSVFHHAEPTVLCGVLKNFAIFIEKHLCWSIFLIMLRPEGLQRYWKETPIQVFSCEYCWIFSNSSWNTSGGCFWLFFKILVINS